MNASSTPLLIKQTTQFCSFPCYPFTIEHLCSAERCIMPQAGAEMASKTWEELRTELAELRKQAMSQQATFGGFTRDEEAAYQERAQLITSLVRQLEDLDDWRK